MAGVSPPTTTPHDLIQREDVKKTLKSDKGLDAVLVSFETKDFTSKGDNYACIVSSVVVQYKKSGTDYETSYVLKINPCRGEKFEGMTTTLFEKETGFYTQFLPLIDEELKRVNESNLRVPKHFHSIEMKGKEVIYLEDLRRSGYLMHDRQTPLDKAHTELIVKELARLHAGSLLMMSREELKGVDMLKRYPIVREAMEEFMDGDAFGGQDIFAMSCESGAKLAAKIPGYEFMSEFLMEKKDDITPLILQLLKCKEPFKVLSHGDCWNNNFLFRYTSGGVPAECRLLDMQIIRLTSPAIDLNHVLYTSLEGGVRRREMDYFIALYYATFASVLVGSQVSLDFTLSQLTKEFYSKNLFGLIWGLNVVPITLMKSEDTPDFEGFFKGDMMEAIKLYQEKTNEMMLASPYLRPRLLDLFDEMKDNGLLKTANVAKLVAKFNGKAFQ